MTTFNLVSEVVHVFAILAVIALVVQTQWLRKKNYKHMDTMIDLKTESAVLAGIGKYGIMGPSGMQGPPGLKGDPGMSEYEFRRFSAQINILHLLGMNKVSGSEYSRLYDMIQSPDTENLIVAEEAIKQLAK